MSKLIEIILSEDDLNDFLNHLIRHESIDGPALGIAKKIVSEGINSLSQKQEDIIKKIVQGYMKYTCERCGNGNVSGLTDYIGIKEDYETLCPSCQYDREKFMKDTD